MIKILFIGCVESSRTFLETLLTVPEAEVVGIVTRRESAFNADFVSLEGIAKRYGIPCFLFHPKQKEELIPWAKEREADIIYCFGWSYLLPDSLLGVTRLGGIGYHPAMLPKNRGRHPIIWALVLGLKETASTFFFLDREADAGDIISQEIVSILDVDDAGTLYGRLLDVGRKQVRSITEGLAHGTYRRMPQDHNKANSWRKRGPKDGRIDWRMPARGIYNLVRALTHPYVGASFLWEDMEIRVWKSEIVSESVLYPNLEPGRILKVDGKSVEIQCGMGVIRLTDYDPISLREGGWLP